MLLTLTSLSSLPVTMMLELSSAKATALTSSWCAVTCSVACRDKSQAVSHGLICCKVRDSGS